MARTYQVILSYLKGSSQSLGDYVGEHSAPTPETGAPLHNLTFNETYPEEVYSNPRYYFSGSDEDGWAWRIISECYKKPSKSVTVYRAVPYQKSSSELIEGYENEKAYILKTGKLPSSAVSDLTPSAYYEKIDKEIENLRKHPQETKDNIKRINPGDWVTIVRKYALDHGRANLSNQFKVISKKVVSSDLWTDGTSLLEWGYHPGAYMRLKREKLASTGAPRIPKSLQGLAAEARKCDSFEEFEHDYLGQIKHGTYWHWTDDPNFKIDPSKGPRDMSSLSTGRVDQGKLMITSHLDAWSDYGPEEKGRPYAALIDMSEVPREAYKQVSRGFGNEFYVSDPSRARVEAVYPRAQAFRVDRVRHGMLPQSSEELEEFYNKVHGTNTETPKIAAEVKRADARYEELSKKYKSGEITAAEKQEAQRMVHEAANKAGYTKTLYRGDRPGKTKFTGGKEDKGLRIRGNIFLFEDPRLAKFYTVHRTNYMRDWRTIGPEEGLYALKVDLGSKVFTMDAKDEDWISVEAPEELGGKDAFPRGIQIDELAKKLNDKGYTAVVIKNIGDQAGYGTQYIVFSPSQLKSAAPFEYADDGTLIPLNKRFSSKGDIRGKVSATVLGDLDLVGISERDANEQVRVVSRYLAAAALPDYVGEHSAPDPEAAAPLNDLTFNGIYPDDVYTNPRQYFSGEEGDTQAWWVISACHKKPSKPVTIYRAVPYKESNSDLILMYEQEKAYILKTGKLPKAAVTVLDTSRYYEYLNDKIEQLKQNPQKEPDNIKRINPGDWVTIVRKYAVEHGQGNLGNKFKVLSKSVNASALWTDGDSLLEWGYHPGVYLDMKRNLDSSKENVVSESKVATVYKHLYTKVPPTGSYPAIQTTDGGLYVDTNYQQSTHVEFAKKIGISPLEIESGGWVTDGVYEPRIPSDAVKWAEQEKARMSALEHRKDRMSKGKTSSTRVVLSYLKKYAEDMTEFEASSPKGTRTVYHGTGKLLNKFNLENAAQGILWFSEDRDKIERGVSGAVSAKYIITAEIRVDKIAGWPEYDKLMLAQIKSQGYDSIKLDDDWVLFDPKRAKIVKVEERQPDGTYKDIGDK